MLFMMQGMWKNVLLRTDTEFFWKQPGKGAFDNFLEQTLERMRDAWKAYKYDPTVSGQFCAVLVHFATHCGCLI